MVIFISEKDSDLDLEDEYRIDFIKNHLKAVHKAIDEGVNVQGYALLEFN